MLGLKRRAGLPIFTVILGSFVLIIVALGALFTFSIKKGAQEKHDHALTENHVLLARNLAELVYRYLDSHVRAISLTGTSISHDSLSKPDIGSQLHQLLRTYPNLRSIVLYRSKGSSPSVTASAGPSHFPVSSPIDFYFNGTDEHLSGVLTNPVTGDNCLLIYSPVTDDSFLIAELSVSPLETLRASFVFGESGYAVIFDHLNRLVAHPNSSWASERKNVSDWMIIHKQRKTHEGVDEFFSPFFNATMVTAYATVPDYGWGVLLPQPRSEIEQYISSVTTRQMTWFVLVVALALILARFLALWISRPICALASHARDLEDEQNACRMQISLATRSPREINQLCYSLNALLTHLRESHARQAKYRSQIDYIADHSPLLLCVCDVDGHIVYASGRLLAKLGHTPITAVNLHITELLPSDSCSVDILDRLQNGEEIVSTLRINSTVIELWCSPIKDSDNANSDHIMIVGTDVSDSHIAALNGRLLEENRSLNENLIRAEENERHRIAGELHDLFGQDLSSIRNFTLLIKNHLKECRPDCEGPLRDVDEYISDIDQIASSLQEVIRSMLARLWPEALDNIGLVGAIQDLLDNFKKQYPGVSLYAHYDFNEELLTNEQSIYIYRIISECLTNVGRHADATEVAVNISIKDEDYLEVLVEDDGVGFRPERLPFDRYGIRGMKERVRALGGYCTIKSAPKGGTAIHAVIPLKCS